MGFVSDLSAISASHADRLLAVDDKWQELVAKKRKDEARKGRKGGKGGRSR